MNKFDPKNLPDDYYRDPYPCYTELRENSPVHKTPDGGYFLTRYADLHHIYRDPKVFLSDKKKQFMALFGESPLYEHHTTSLVFNDPPLHTHVRKAIGDALSHKTVAALVPKVEVIVDRLCHEIAEKKQFDLLADFAIHLPIEIIGELMRIPRHEQGPLQNWSAAILGALEADIDESGKGIGNRAVADFIIFLEELVKDRRQTLTDDEDDLLARLIKWEQEGEQLSTTQIYHQCIFILNAGHETTANLISNGLVAMLEHPDQLDLLKSEPELIDSTVEELLRYEASVQLGNRTTSVETEVGDVTIPAGTILTLAIGSANRDPDKFKDPDRLDITRDPNPHLSFAHGIHTCAGNNIARLEARVAIQKILSHFPKLAIDGRLQRQHRARFRCFESVPMVTGE